MKKIFIIFSLVSLSFLNSCTDSTPTSDDYKQVNESFSSTGTSDNAVEKAQISNDTNYEATEEPETTSTGETATVTSFGSGGTDDDSGSIK